METMACPSQFLNLGDVGIMRENIRCGRRTHRIHARTIGLYVQACCLSVPTLSRGFTSTAVTHKRSSMQSEQGSGNILTGWRKRYQEWNITVALFY